MVKVRFDSLGVTHARGQEPCRYEVLGPIYRAVMRVISAVMVNSAPLAEGRSCQVPP